MRRVILTLRESFPDLEVSVEGQEAEGDLVRTHIHLSGIDRGSVLWFPATGRHADFRVIFEDRFRRGELVEHGGRSDTGELLRQLGHPRQHSDYPEEASRDRPRAPRERALAAAMGDSFLLLG